MFVLLRLFIKLQLFVKCMCLIEAHIKIKVETQLGQFSENKLNI